MVGEIGNKDAEANAKWKTPEELQKKIDEFKQYCLVNKVPQTLSRLACFLDCSTETLRRYGKNDPFCATIKKIRQAIEADKEERLITNNGNVSGLIFDLKNNHGYVDKTEREIKQQTSIKISEEDKEKLDNILGEN